MSSRSSSPVPSESNSATDGEEDHAPQPPKKADNKKSKLNTSTIDKKKPGEESLVVKVCDPNVVGSFLNFRIKKTAPLSKVINAYCKEKKLDQKGLRFLFDGDRIGMDDTPLKLNMQNDDAIEIYSAQDGGIYCTVVENV